MSISPRMIRAFFLVGILTLVTATAWAVPVRLTVQNGNFNDLPPSGGFSATFIHNNATGGGSPIPDYNPLNGILMAELTEISGVGIILTGITGSLTGPGGVFNIVDGIIAQFTGNQAEGFFDFNIVGGSLDGISGSDGFNEDPSAFLFDAGELNNHLTSTVLQLWGGSAGNNIGMDFRADIEAIPEPASIILFGTGLLVIMAWAVRRCWATE